MEDEIKMLDIIEAKGRRFIVYKVCKKNIQAFEMNTESERLWNVPRHIAKKVGRQSLLATEE